VGEEQGSREQLQGIQARKQEGVKIHLRKILLREGKNVGQKRMKSKQEKTDFTIMVSKKHLTGHSSMEVGGEPWRKRKIRQQKRRREELS